MTKKLPWYSEGLRFSCTECGRCCTGSPGYVWVTEKEVKEIADFLKLSVAQFSARYLRRAQGKLSLLEKVPHFDCVFLQERKCSIYSVRPKQCRKFPWWVRNLRSKEEWEEAATRCEGINDQAPLVSFAEIEEQLEDGID